MQTERRELQGEHLSRLSSPKRQVQTRVRPTAASNRAGAPSSNTTKQAEWRSGAHSIDEPEPVRRPLTSWSAKRRGRGSERTAPRTNSGTTFEADKVRGPPPGARAERSWSGK